MSMVCNASSFLKGESQLTASVDANVNGGVSADIALTVRGSDWYWAVCAVMTVATFAFAGLAQTKPRQGMY